MKCAILFGLESSFWLCQTDQIPMHGTDAIHCGQNKGWLDHVLSEEECDKAACCLHCFLTSLQKQWRRRPRKHVLEEGVKMGGHWIDPSYENGILLRSERVLKRWCLWIVLQLITDQQATCLLMSPALHHGPKEPIRRVMQYIRTRFIHREWIWFLSITCFTNVYVLFTGQISLHICCINVCVCSSWLCYWTILSIHSCTSADPSRPQSNTFAMTVL